MRSLTPQAMLTRLNLASKPFAEDGSHGLLRRYWYWAVIVALLIAAINVNLIVTFDNTNLDTTNGLWKTPGVYGWEHASGTSIDNGGMLYYRVYGLLSRLIPDRWMQFGTPSPVVTFRKMAVLDGLFGGIASGLVFLLALRFSGSVTAALIVVLAHAGAGFVLVNSINSEDIIPGYTFFLGATVCFFEFLRLTKVWLLVLAAFLLAFATLFHWTVMAPALAAFGMVCLMLMRRSADYFWLGLVWLIGFLCATQFLVLALLTHIRIPIWSVLLPSKVDSGWVGFHSEKLIFMLIGVGNYFAGAENVSDYHGLFQKASFVRPMLVSWTFLAVGLIACIAALFSKRAPLSLKCFAAFWITVCIAAEVGNLYSQPQDPQMQLQPMFAAHAGLIVLARWISQARSWLRRALAVGGAAAVMANGATNVQTFQSRSGWDGKSIRAVTELEQLFPHDGAIIVNQGFEGWLSWQYVLLAKGDWAGFRLASFDLVRPFLIHRGITGAAAADWMRSQIDGALAHGQPVVACSLWTQTPAEFVASMSTVAGQQRATEYEAGLRNSFEIGQKWETQAGRFVQLLPKSVAQNGR